MTVIAVARRVDVAPAPQEHSDALEQQRGFAPSRRAVRGSPDSTLAAYLALQSARSSLSDRARDVVNLAVSQVNECHHCLAAHATLAKMNGFTDAQILKIRNGAAGFDRKLDALARLVRAIAIDRGHVDQPLVDAFFAAGWTRENLVDAIILVGSKAISNYLHAITQVPGDFPAAAECAVELMT